MAFSTSEKRATPSIGAVPRMTLSTGDASSKTGPPPPMPHYISNEGRAIMRFSVEGNAILTGGAGNLALVNARALLEHGLTGLALFDLNPSQATTEIEALRQDFPSSTILPVKVDITNAEQLQSAVDMTSRELGDVNILCCFADVKCSAHATEVSSSEWRRTLDVNTTGSFLCAQAVARSMIDSGDGGTIVLIASVSAHRVGYPQPQAAYNASKAALVSLKSSLAAEWAQHGIRVNTISPGYMELPSDGTEDTTEVRRIWTERIPMGRLGQPEELTGPLILLCSGAGSYITGADLSVNGGQACF